MILPSNFSIDQGPVGPVPSPVGSEGFRSRLGLKPNLNSTVKLVTPHKCQESKNSYILEHEYMSPSQLQRATSPSPTPAHLASFVGGLLQTAQLGCESVASSC